MKTIIPKSRTNIDINKDIKIIDDTLEILTKNYELSIKKIQRGNKYLPQSFTQLQMVYLPAIERLEEERLAYEHLKQYPEACEGSQTLDPLFTRQMLYH